MPISFSTGRLYPSTAMWRAYNAFLRANVPVLLEGHPGLAKSAKVSASAEKDDFLVRCVVGSVREASDYLGLPIEIDGAVHNSPPEWAVDLNQADKAVLLLDELNTASPSTSKAMLRTLQERFVGDYQLGSHVRIVAIANPPETSVDGWELLAPIANRMGHLDWHFDADEWLSGVASDFVNVDTYSPDDLSFAGRPEDRARASSLITGFLNEARHLLSPNPPTDPVVAGKAWPSPRSWTNLRDVLAELPADDEKAIALVVQGLVGQGAYVAFHAWTSSRDLYDPASVLADPSIVDWSSERPDRLFGLLNSVEALAMSLATGKAWEQAVAVMVACAHHDKVDVALPSVRVLLNHRPANTTFSNAARDAFSDLMKHTRHGFAA